MKPWLYVGAKVVCVDARRSKLAVGAVYTVRSISHDGFVRLAEVRLDLGGEDGWFAYRFRPVSTINTDAQVEALRKIARDAMQNGRADA